MSLIFLIALGFQLATRRYIPSIYWTVVVLISIVGTLISDNVTDNLGISLTTTSVKGTSGSQPEAPNPALAITCIPLMQSMR